MPCPKCGGVWTRQSGIRRCKSCGHAYGSQDATNHAPRYSSNRASIPADEWEDETLIRDKPGRRVPLDFDAT